MKEDPKLQGLCKKCTHRNSCADAKRHLNMTDCSSYRPWKKREWTSVDERLPEGFQAVVVTDGDGYAVGFWRDDAKAWDNENFGWLERSGNWSSDDGPCRLGKVTHWLPFPEFKS